MKTKEKIITVLVAFLILCIFAGFGAFKAGDAKTTVKSVSDIKVLGGVKNRMPANSSFVFWQSLIGSKLSNYKEYKNIDETLCALRSSEISAMWTTDVTAEYLVRNNSDLICISTDGMSDLQNTNVKRFDFAMAVKSDNEELRDLLNSALLAINEDGLLDELCDRFIRNYNTSDVFFENEMSCTGADEIVVGVTGAVPPIEIVDENGDVSGFCVALMNEIGLKTGKKIRFEVLDGETIFTSLMSGRIDVVFSYGTGMSTTENKKNYIMTDGYYPMNEYLFIGCR